MQRRTCVLHSELVSLGVCHEMAHWVCLYVTSVMLGGGDTATPIPCILASFVFCLINKQRCINYTHAHVEGPSENGNEHTGSIKCCEIPERLVVTQEGLSSMEVVGVVTFYTVTVERRKCIRQKLSVCFIFSYYVSHKFVSSYGRNVRRNIMKIVG
jgi:hypothetical protein